MTSIIAVIISAVTVVVVVLILGVWLFGTRILKLLEKHNKFGNSNHQAIINNYNKILEDTNTLKFDSKMLLKIGEKLEGKVETINKNLSKDKENKKVQIESLPEKQRKMKDSIDRLVGFAEEYENLSSENAKLWRENEALTEENKELSRIIKLQKVRISELEVIERVEV